MVSTRGIKLKFFVGERVLCYEPDPTKAKVLYDSKVLDILIKKDQNGKKVVEYLIHFQGWNSSWDRCVGEDHVLKDTPDNRQLQRDLAERAQLQLGAYLYRKERKKRKRSEKSDNQLTASEEGSSDSLLNAENTEGSSSSSDENSSVEEEHIIDIELTPELQEIIETDYDLVKQRNKVLRLPAEPNIITILEMYYKHYVTNQICGLNEKPNSRRSSYSNHKNNAKPKPQDVQRNLQICREVMDGLRIYFDFTLKDSLLYMAENGQIQTSMAVAQLVKSENAFSSYKNHSESKHHASEDSTNNHNQNGHNTNNSLVNPRKRSLRSSTSKSLSESSTCSSNNGNGHPADEASTVSLAKSSSSSTSSNSDMSNPMTKALAWRLLPDYAYSQQPPPPSLVYGATHLVRLFVKLPELLAASNIPDIKLKVLLRHFDLIIDYLTEHKEWFGEKFYIDAQ